MLQLVLLVLKNDILSKGDSWYKAGSLYTNVKLCRAFIHQNKGYRMGTMFQTGSEKFME